MSDPIGKPDPWLALRQFTAARIALVRPAPRVAVLATGDIVRAVVEEADEHDLYGVPVA